MPLRVNRPDSHRVIHIHSRRTRGLPDGLPSPARFRDLREHHSDHEAEKQAPGHSGRRNPHRHGEVHPATHEVVCFLLYGVGRAAPGRVQRIRSVRSTSAPPPRRTMSAAWNWAGVSESSR